VETPLGLTVSKAMNSTMSNASPTPDGLFYVASFRRLSVILSIPRVHSVWRIITQASAQHLFPPRIMCLLYPFWLPHCGRSGRTLSSSQDKYHSTPYTQTKTQSHTHISSVLSRPKSLVIHYWLMKAPPGQGHLIYHPTLTFRSILYVSFLRLVLYTSHDSTCHLFE
jgi:hypothetical protein